MKSQRAVIIIPTYNERENITKLLPVLVDLFKTIPKEFEMKVLVVDDSSPDGTASAVEAFSKKNDDIHLLVNAHKAGLGAAYLAGMREAFGKLDADIVFEFDADFSHDPKKIPHFLQKIREGYDLVLGSRYIAGGSIPENWGLHRKFLSVFGNLFINIVLTTFSIRDWTTGYRALTRRVFEAVEKEMTGERFSGYTWQIGFLHKAVRKGFRIAEIPFRFVDRTHGHSKLGAEYVKNTLQYIIRVRIKEITEMRVFKFGVVGFLGFAVNTIGLFVFTRVPFLESFAVWFAGITGLTIINISGVAAALGAECAIVSNFTFNNLWTFKDRKLTSPAKIVGKFIQFNLSSFGAVLIQFLVVGAGTSVTGQETISRLFWLVVATGIGMVVNYFVYSRIIWKAKR
jgi:dolichol-phosphate mannosyltransferase